ncbi:MAG: cytochrome c oxidase subunit II [Sphingomonas sp.]|jgi:cytochrome c oxidase subunit 2
MTVAMAAGLSLGGVGHATVAATAAPVAQAAPAPADTAKPGVPAGEAAPAKPAALDPMLALDGGPMVLPAASVGQPENGKVGTQAQATPTGLRAKTMHDWVLVPVISVISVFVLLLLIWAVYRYRAAANPVPSKTSHNTLLEVLWTGIPIIILAGIAVPSIGLLLAQYKPAPANAITLKAIGNQWYWSYEYPDNGGFEVTANMLKEKGLAASGERARVDADGPALLATDNRVVLPVGVPIRLITTSADVIHSWAIPAFWIKLDAVPGRLNETSFIIEKPGVYFGQCSELCGVRHGFMPITVAAVDKATFDKWVVAKGGSVKGAAPAAPAVVAAASTTSPATDAAARAAATADN